MDALCSPGRLLCWWVTSAVALVVGCAPPPPQATEAQLSVGMPTGVSSDPGRLTEGAIVPPVLSDLGDDAGDATSGDGVSRGSDRASTLVQTEKRRPGQVEVVPTPKAQIDPRSRRQGKPELVPTPPGIAAGKAAAPASGGVPIGVGKPPDYRTWPVPDVTLVVTGQQHGYIEPCGCTGLDKQKGGVARRFTFMDSLRRKGWTLLPIDAGNQVRRFGRQAEIKLQQTAKALHAMDYQAVGFGPDDLRMGVGELLAVAAAERPEDAMYVSANVVLIDPSLMPQQRVIDRGGLKVGVTSILDPEDLDVPSSEEILVNPIAKSAGDALKAMAAEDPDYQVLLFFGDEKRAQELVREVPGFDLIVVAGGYGEPTYRAEQIEDSRTKMIVTGSKGMYAGLVGLYADKPMAYARVPLTHEFVDAPEMRQLMADYQDQLRDVGLASLGLKPIPHPSGRKYVGSEKCGECHKTAFDIWEGTPHFDATEHLVKPPKERSDVARHFDPECLSCHVTGWNPQNYYPYESGFLSLEKSAHLTGNGCENCHGPGADHSAAEALDAGVSADRLEKLRDQMKLAYDDAREKCMVCHDIDNSPDFHEDDAFEDIYWPEIEHVGVD